MYLNNFHLAQIKLVLTIIVVIQEADCRFEFSVKAESDTGLSGQWMEDDVTMTPYRRVLLLSADKLEPVIQRIKEYVVR